MRFTEFLKYLILFKWLRGGRSNVQSASEYRCSVLHDGSETPDILDISPDRSRTQDASGIDEPKMRIFRNSGYIYDPEIFEGLEEDEYEDAFKDVYGEAPLANLDDIYGFHDGSDNDCHPFDDIDDLSSDIDDCSFDHDDFDPDW